jgi:hypothetical protein
MTAIRKLLSLARIGAARVAAFSISAFSDTDFMIVARPVTVRAGARMGTLRLYSLPRGVRQR